MDDNDFLASLKGKKETTPPAPVVPPVETKVEATPTPPIEVVAPPVETTPPPQAPTGIEAYNQRFKETFGYESVDDFFNSDAAVKVKEYDSIKSRLAEKESEVGLLYSEFGAATNPFANETAYKVNHLMKQHSLDFNTATALVNTDLGRISPLEVLLMNERLKDPDMPEKHTKLLLAKELGADSWDDLMSDDSETYKDLIEAKSLKAKKELAKYDVSGIEAPATILPEQVKERLDAQKAAREQAYANIEQAWKPATDWFESNFNELDIPVINAESKIESFTKVVLKPEEKKAYSEAVLSFCKERGLTEINEKTKPIVQQYLSDIMYLDKLPHLFKIVADKAKSDAILEMQRAKDNPEVGAGKNPNPAKPVDNTAKRDIMDILPKPKSVFDRLRK